jgi:hypothetical protein
LLKRLLCVSRLYGAGLRPDVESATFVNGRCRADHLDVLTRARSEKWS